MFNRSYLPALLCVSLILPIVGCGSSSLSSIQVGPGTVTAAAGTQVQFTATGIYVRGDRLPTNKNLTGSVKWVSASQAVATIDSTSGMATAVSAGTTTITASADGYPGLISGSASLTVTGSASGSSGDIPLSLTIIPSSITVGNLQGTGQFLAIGTFANSPTVRDLTNSPTLTWISATPSVFPVNNTNGNPGATAGIVTAYGSGNGVITAEATSKDGTVQTATATFNCPLVLPTATSPGSGSCYPGSEATPLLVTLTVYNEGLNDTNWLVTAPSATGTPNVINCGPGAAPNTSVCVATYPPNTPEVTLTAPANGAAFGGWSYNCTNTAPITPAGPDSCTVLLNSTNVTVGVIFN